MPRFYCPIPLSSGALLDLPAGAARHVQVLRLQPGDGITLFNGLGGEFAAIVKRMGRSDVTVEVGPHSAVEREAPCSVHLVVGTPANERMDWLVEKAAELGAASVTPLLTERSVLRLSGERALKKQAHWQAIAIAASEQCGRNRVPPVAPLTGIAKWMGNLTQASGDPGQRFLLTLSAQARTLVQARSGATGPVLLLSGPEGGLSAEEEAAALACGFEPVTLGPRVLRAETAPLAALALLQHETPI